MDTKNRTVLGKKSNAGKKYISIMRYASTTVKITIVMFITVFSIVAGLLGGAIFGYIKTAQPIKDDQLNIKILTSFIYDSRGNVIATLTGRENKNRELVYYKDIPEHLKNAFVAVEDERFYKHIGIDLRRIASAAFSYITSGSIKHGGSTITQQVVRNVTGQTEQTLKRKVQEQWNAIQLERRLAKWQILELYMNIIYMGNGYYGVQAASKGYFNKDVKDLSVAESAFLAGITNNPGVYNPFTKEGRLNAKKRQEMILGLMLKQGYIDENQYKQALAEVLKINEQGSAGIGASVQSYFVDQVISDVKKDLMAKRGMTENMALTTIYNYGLKIYTTQDSEVQNAMDEVFTDDKYFPDINPKAQESNENPQAAMVIIDPGNGQVKALYGGYGLKKASNTLNRATQTQRQPGSSFKPIAVYAPAIDLGLITPATIIDDIPVYMLGTDKPRYPENYDRKYGGLTSIRDGVKKSINVVAAKVWNDMLGSAKSIEYLQRVGIDREKEKNNLSISMGGLKEGVSPLQMAAAYVPFASRGMYYKPTTYTKVVDSKGRTILENKFEYNIVYKETTAFLMTDMLKEVVKPGGTAYPRGQIQNSKKQIIPTAGKTGTTNDNIDKWFVGFSPYYVAAVWYGYDNRTKPIELIRGEYNQAQEIWKAVMSKVHNDKEPVDFVQPRGLVKRKICIYSGKLASELCTQDPRGSAVREEYFVKGTEPSELCDMHVKAKVCKDHTDIWGRRFIADSYCPEDSVIEDVFIQRKEPYMPLKPGDPYPQDWKYELPAGEYCNAHGAPDETK